MIDSKIICVFGGLALATLAGCGDAAIVVPAPLSIVSIQPTQGAINVAGKTISVAFSAPIEMDEDAVADHFQLKLVGTSNKTNVPLTADFQQDGKYVVLSSESDLVQDNRYEFTVVAPIASTQEDVLPLDTSVTVSFRTAAEIKD